MNAYTYIIKCPNGKSYYGYRSANKVSPEDDLWKKYFTSSKFIKELREQYSDDEFIATIDKTFESADDARAYEEKFLTENNCVHNDSWLNRANNGKDWNSTGEGTRRKISQAHKGKLAGEKNPFYGKKHSEASLQKIREANTGRVHTAETRKKMSDSGKGKVFTEEHKRKISESNKGKVVSEETRRKNGEASRKRVWTEESRKRLSESLKAHYDAKKRNEKNVTIEIHEK
jgi:hypothetical protein